MAIGYFKKILFDKFSDVVLNWKNFRIFHTLTTGSPNFHIEAKKN